MKKLALLCVAGFVTLAGCKPKTLSNVLRDPPPEHAGDTLTDKRVSALNVWAAKLLSSTDEANDYQRLAHDYFVREGVRATKTLAQAYTLTVRDSPECFYQGSNPMNDRDLWLNLHHAQIVKQVDSAARFLLEYHKAMNGNPKGAFQITDLEICTERAVQRKLKWEGTKLVIGVPYDMVNGYSVVTSDQLMTLWNEGAQFDMTGGGIVEAVMGSKFQKLWLFVNPVSFVRVGLRKFIRDRGPAIAQLLKSSGIMQAFSGVSPSRNADAAINAFTSNGKKDLFLKNWECKLADSQIADEISLSAMGKMMTAVAISKSKVNIKLRSDFMAIGNFHNVHVNAFAYSGPYDKYVDTSPISEGRVRDVEMNVEVDGKFFAMFFGDDVNVDVGISRLRQMATGSIDNAAFDEAKLATEQNRKLCN